jgi:DNA-binding NtrC family response regulator
MRSLIKILVIDDSQSYLNTIKNLCKISLIDSEVVCVLDAFEALKYISQNHQEIGVVFTDYDMKKFGMSGTIIAEKCTETKIPVIICTGHLEINLNLPYQVISKINVDYFIKIARELPGRKSVAA